MAKTPAELKRDQREREKAALSKNGGRRLSFIVYGGTLDKLEKICKEEGFSGKQRLGEALTFLIENHES